MEKDFVPYEQALALKELGFDEPCFCIYNREKVLRFNNLNNPNDRNKGIKLTSNNGRYPAPLYQQAFRWFREKYQVYPIITLDQTTYPKFSYDITEFIGNPINLSEKEWGWKVLFSDGLYRTYEEAELECLKKLIEIVNEKI